MRAHPTRLRSAAALRSHSAAAWRMQRSSSERTAADAQSSADMYVSPLVVPRETSSSRASGFAPGASALGAFFFYGEA